MKFQSGRHGLQTAILLIAGFALGGAGCAKIADPQPPQVRIPKPAADLAAHQVADAILLTVSKPAQNTDGTPVGILRSLEVFRLAEAAKNSGSAVMPEKEFLAKSALILSIPSASFPNYLRGSEFLIRDRLPAPQASSPDSRAFRYAVVFVNDKRQAAGLSNQAFIRPLRIPPPPDELSAEVTEHSIRLKWQAPPMNRDGADSFQFAGYEVCRSENSDMSASAVISPDLLQNTEFEDRDFGFDKTYYYAVRTMGSRQNPRAESLLSKTFAVAARDVFPPAPPGDLNSLIENGTVVLLWGPSSSNDVAGYRIYRKEQGAAASQLLQKELIAGWSFRDDSAVAGKRYEYLVHAVDTHGNEGAAVRATVEIR